MTDTAQPNTIIHDDGDWGLKVTADLGVLRNVGYQEYFSDEIADQDSILMAVAFKGVAIGTETLTISAFTDGVNSNTPDIQAALEVTAALTPVSFSDFVMRN